MIREAASFRDPSGYILYGLDREVYRSLNLESYTMVQQFLEGPAYASLLEQELIIPTELAGQNAVTETRSDRYYLRHKRLELITYPYEWTPQMLLDAAKCTLEVQLELMNHGFSLKDASAYNIQFDFGSNGLAPVFIDVGSIELLTDPIWLAYKQFVSHFLLPLFLYHDKNHDFRGTFLTEMDGLDPEEAYCLLGMSKFLSPYFTLVTLPHWLGKGAQKTQPREQDPERTFFIMHHTIRSLQRKLNCLRFKPVESEWTAYEDSNTYPDDARATKQVFGRHVWNQIEPQVVLDIGCNTGYFSFQAAYSGSQVIALDTDSTCLDFLYRKTQKIQSKILPLRVDIANPSPGIGWKNQERASFLDRLGQVDCVFALAVVHHLLITKGIPLLEIAGLFHDLTKEYLLVELIGPADPMFQSLLRGRGDLYSEFVIEAQEAIFIEHFSIIEQLDLPGMDRTLYLMRKK